MTKIKYATLIPYDYRPPFVMMGRGRDVLMPGTIFVDKDKPSPDPLKKMLWGFDADGNFGPGDFKKYFKKRPGIPISVPYDVEGAMSAHEEQVRKGAAIRRFLATYRGRGGAERAIQPEAGRDSPPESEGLYQAAKPWMERTEAEQAKADAALRETLARKGPITEREREAFGLPGAEKPGSSTFAMKPGTETATSDGRKVRVIYAGPWSWRAKSESRIVVLYWPDKDEYSTHEQTMKDLAFYSGHYFTSLSSALEDFEERTGIRPPESVFRTKGLPG